MAKGHILRDEDIRLLQLEGMERIWVTELDEDEVSEDAAVCGIAGEMACCWISPAASIGASAAE